MGGGQCAELRVEQIEIWMFLQCFFNARDAGDAYFLNLSNWDHFGIILGFGSFWQSGLRICDHFHFAILWCDFPATGSKVLWPTEPLGASQSAKSHSECAFAKEQFGHTLCRLKEERNSHM